MIDKHQALKQKLQRLRDENPHASFQSLWNQCARESPELIPQDDSRGSDWQPSSHGNLETDMGQHYRFLDTPKAGNQMSFSEHVEFFNRTLKQLDLSAAPPVLTIQGEFAFPLTFVEH